ncbi:MAG: hypothetical protein K0R67_2353 [Paenibacillus sp.]|jgi:AraC-like DNA-binding protein|nr:hypothetical protein [Paenibacillus sp.]
MKDTNRKVIAMKFEGYRRWLLSYLPILYIVTAALLFIFFMAMSSYAHRQTLQANETYAENVLRTVDSTLHFTEMTMIKELLTNDLMRQFFDQSGRLMSSYDTFMLSERLSDWATMMQPIGSIYLYRSSDHTVLSSETMLPLKEFGDSAFIEGFFRDPPPYAWTEARQYRQFVGEGGGTKVISLVKPVPLLTGSQGLIVVNLRITELESLIDGPSTTGLHNYQIIDSAGNPFLGTKQAISEPASRLQSSYTGWTIITDFAHKKTFDLLSTFSVIWFTAGVVTVAVGTIWMIYVVRHNYRPIERIKATLMNVNGDAVGRSSVDEFAFVTTSLEQLIETSRSYEQTYKESMLMRRKWLFLQLIEGNQPTDEEWKAEINRLSLPESFDVLIASIVEIDGYSDFIRDYSNEDQNLIKFVFTSVVKEIVEDLPIQVWCEWIKQEQLGVLLTLQDHHQEPLDIARQFGDRVQSWTEQHMNLTVTIATGGAALKLADISRSFHEALEALQYKSAIGGNRVITYDEMLGFPQAKLYKHLQDIRLLAEYYRGGDESWKRYLEKLFAGLKASMIRKDDIISLMKHVIYTFDKEMMTLPDQMSAVWEHEAAPHLRQFIESFYDLEDLENRFMRKLHETEDIIKQLRENRDSPMMISKVKGYIDAHYGDSDLSLDLLSDRFKLNLKSLSRMFKEETGENFIDYLTKLRIEHAKQMLLAYPNDPVQHISSKVGYLHVNTFIRVFKKQVGMTPGEYRKALA